MKKDNGSALILAILVLSFFMALSMNLYFIAEKKAERAGVKNRGQKVLNNIDTGSSLGYFELRVGSDCISKPDMDDRVNQRLIIKLQDFSDYYTKGTVNSMGFDWRDDGDIGKKITGTGITYNETEHAFGIGSGATATRYIWNIPGLNNATNKTVAGYHLKRVEVTSGSAVTIYGWDENSGNGKFFELDSAGNYGTEQADPGDMFPFVGEPIEYILFVYEKSVTLVGNDDAGKVEIPSKTYILEYRENWKDVPVTLSNGNISPIGVENEEIRVELQTINWE